MMPVTQFPCVLLATLNYLIIQPDGSSVFGTGLCPVPAFTESSINNGFGSLWAVVRNNFSPMTLSIP